MKWTDDEILFLKENYNILGRAECAKILQRSVDSIATKIRDSRLNLHSKETWSNDDIIFLKKYYKTNGVSYCAKKLCTNKRRIIYKANSLGLRTDIFIKSESKNKKYVNFNLFTKNLTKESVYILGLLWADGHVRAENKTTSISCIQTDIECVIPTFLTTGDWLVSKSLKKYFKGNEVKTQKKISTTTWGLFNVLKEYNFLNKSSGSPDKMINNIPSNLKKYWFRGFLDGDGCIRLGKKYGTSIVFSGPYKQNWTFITNLCNFLKIHYRIDRVTVKLGSYSHFNVYRKNDVKILGDYLYSDYDGIGFVRKYKKYLDVCARINNIIC
jgi:hypothetical protein